MWTDGELPELLSFATKLNLSHRWLQKPPKASWTHFDISLGYKQDAIKMGAVLTDKYGPVEFTWREVIKDSYDEVKVGKAKRYLAHLHATKGISRIIEEQQSSLF